MARIYNPTMLMLDPSNVMNAVRLGREREAQEREARKGIATGIGEIGGALAGIGGRALRQSEIGELPEDADEEWKAVVERFVDTGDISGINAYKQRKAEESYRNKMLALQDLQAQSAKSASEASLAEGKRKDREIIERERDDAEYGLTKAITAYRKGGVAQPEAEDDYNYYRKKLKRIYKELGIPEEEIRPLKNEQAVPPVPAKIETGAEDVSESEQNTEEFSGDEFVTRKNKLKSRIKSGKFPTDSDTDELVREATILSNSPHGRGDAELVDLIAQAKSIKSDEAKARDAKAYEQKMADGWEAMSKAERYSLTKKDPKTAKKMQDAWVKIYGGK